MIEQALRRFCELRHRTLIVIAGTFVVGLLLVIPLVDAYRNGWNEKEALLSELETAAGVAAELGQFESRVAHKLAQLAVLEARTVNDETLPALRSKLVDLAQETKCSIRRLNVGAVSSRPWSPGESPVATASEAQRGGSNSAFVLEWRPVSISLSGPSANLRSMLERLEAAEMLVHAKAFDMYPASPSRQSLTLDMELWYFALARRR